MLRRPQLMPELIDALWRDTEGVDLVDYEISNSSGTVLKYEQGKDPVRPGLRLFREFSLHVLASPWTRAASSRPPT